MRLGCHLALGLNGYYSELPKGSTISTTTQDPGPSLIEGPKMVADGRYHMAITTPSFVAQMAAEGRGFFDTPLGLRALAAFPHDDRLVLAVREESDIQSVREIIT